MSGWQPGHSWLVRAMSTPACCWLGATPETEIARRIFWIRRWQPPAPWEWASPKESGRLQVTPAAESVPTGRAPPPAAAVAAPELPRNLFRREGEYWTVAYDGAVVRLRDAKGLHYLAQLLTHPGREFHVIDLEAADIQVAPAVVGGSRPGSGEPQLTLRPDLGDAGFLLDAAAKRPTRLGSRSCARS
jgi:hypothetical protein